MLYMLDNWYVGMTFRGTLSPVFSRVRKVVRGDYYVRPSVDMEELGAFFTELVFEGIRCRCERAAIV